MNKKFLLVAGVLTIVSGNVMGAVTTDDQGTISYSDRYSSFPTTLKDGANFNQRHIEFSTMDTTKSSGEFKVSEFTSESMQIEDNRNNDRNSLYADSNGLTVSYSERTGPNNFQTRENLELTLHKVSMNNNRVEKVANGIESKDAVNLSQLQEVENKIKDVASGSNITVKKELDFFGRETNTSVVNLNKDLVDMNSIKFGTEDDNVKSEINQTSVSFYNDKQNEGSALTSHSLEMNTKNGSSSLDGTSLTISNGIDGNIATMGANGFATETKDGKHLEFSSDNVTVAGQQIHDVAKGIDDTDAVNVKQLKEYMSTNDKDTITTVKAGNNIEVTANGHDYTVSLNKDVVDKIDNATAGVKSNADAIKSNADAIKSNADAIKANTADIADNKAQIDNLVNQIGNNDTKINNMINNTREEARRGIASASALAALHPLDYNPDHKVDVMGGVGHYRGKTAVALGAAYRPNENLMFTVGTAINGKDSSVNAGVSYKVGAKDSTYKSQASLAKDVEDLKQIVAKLQAELEEARKK
jgi:hypothetical protein